MATLTLSTIRSLTRSALNDTGTARLTLAELNTLANDGYKDVSVKGICYESRITDVTTNITAGACVVSLVGKSVIRVNHVAYVTTTAEKGLARIDPRAHGHLNLSGAAPQFWFPWGDFIVIDPAPDVGTYDLAVYAARYPAAAMSADADTPTNLPAEFHECVYLFARAFARLKLRQWGKFVEDYNDYTQEVQRRKFEYIMKHPDPREAREMPPVVEVSHG